MKQFVWLLLCCIGLLPAKAQWYDSDKVPRKAQLMYSGAMEAMRENDWDNARILLNRSLEAHPRYLDAMLSLAGLYGQLKKYDSAIIYYERGIVMDSIYSFETLLPLSINLAGMGRFEHAKEAVEHLLANPRIHRRTAEAARYRLDTYQFAIGMTARHGQRQPLNPRNLGDSINSKFHEYYPSFTVDDSMMVFTRLSGANVRREDFMKTTLITKGQYRKAALVEGSLNDEPFKGGLSVSQDGQWLIFAADYGQKGMGNFDIYISYVTPTGWGQPLNLGAAINTEFWESGPTLSPDKQTLIFSSNRPGGFGGKDLYMSHRQANGKWSPAENMGENFNTSGDDQAPFIHADNQTMYFTSNGHKGYGGSDIFISRKGPGGAWSVPENLGYPVNTIEDEGSMMVTADGQTAYYAANGADSRGGLDLYAFEMPAYARPKRTLWIKGVVQDAVTNKRIPAAIELKDIATGQVIERVITDETGFYLATLPVGQDYTFTVNRKGYLFYSDNFLLSKQNPDSTYQKDILLQPITVNSQLVLKNILFATNSAVLDPSSHIELQKLVTLLAENPGITIQINGHTDNTGQPGENLRLSTNRAKAVVDYLTTQGIAGSRLSFKGFGATKPLADNNTESGKAINRRTEVVVLTE